MPLNLALGSIKMVVFVRRLYFWVFLSLQAVLLGIEFRFEDPEPWGMAEYLSYLTLPFGIAALFGYAYNIKLLNQWVWVIVAAVVLSNEVIYGISYFIYSLVTTEELHPIVWSELLYPIGTMLIFVPYWIGLAKYSLSKQLWRKT